MKKMLVCCGIAFAMFCGMFAITGCDAISHHTTIDGVYYSVDSNGNTHIEDHHVELVDGEVVSK